MRTFAIKLYKSLLTPSRDKTQLSGFIITFKALFSIFIIAYILFKLLGENRSFFDHLGQLTWIDTGWIILALAGMWLNLGFEALKWWVMVRKSEPQYPFHQALVSVFSGLTAGIFTPNRIGDYVGRIAYLPPQFRVKAIAWLFIDRLCQMMITIWMGLIAFEYFWNFHLDTFMSLIPVGIEYLHVFRGALWIIAILFPVSLITIPFAARYIHFLNRYTFFQKLSLGFEELSTQLLLKIWGLGLMRYITFSFQYYLLLIAFGYQGDFMLAFAMILAVFLIKSVIPSITLTELGIRESVAITIMGGFAVSGFIAFSSTFLLYIINIILPALVGLFFLNKLKI